MTSADIKDLLQAAASIFAILMGIIALIKSNRQKQTDELTKTLKEMKDGIESTNEKLMNAIEKTNGTVEKVNGQLQQHIVADATDIATLKANIGNVQTILSSNLNSILNRLE